MKLPHFSLPLPVVDWRLGLYLGSLVVGIGGIAGSWYKWSLAVNSAETVRFEASPDKEMLSPHIIVEVNGAVRAPGVYELQPDDRVAQAVTAAGGLLPTADPQYVEKTLALASPVTDGQKIYIPSQTERAADTQAVGATSRVNLNEAPQSALESLPGIGATKAQRITELRPLTSLQQLVDAKVLSAKQLDDLSGLIEL